MSNINNFSPLWGEWHIGEFIGKGTFGSVYKATKEEYGKKYFSAIKHIQIPPDGITASDIMSEGFASDNMSLKTYYDALRDKLLNEISNCYELKGNTNIVSYEGHLIIPKENNSGYDVFIRMELLQSLPEFMSTHILTEEQVLQLGIDICNGLSVLDRKNIVHRDIKPANIFINSDGIFKLGDFGEAKVLSQTTNNMSIKGTFNFMAPEIVHGTAANKTVDIYSLGIVMYRLLNYNCMPFVPLPPEGITSNVINIANARRLKGEKLQKPANCKTDELANIILKACGYNPTQRWQSAEEMCIALKNLQNKLIHRDDLKSQNNELEKTVSVHNAIDYSDHNNNETPVNNAEIYKNTISSETQNKNNKNLTKVLVVISVLIVAVIIVLMIVLNSDFNKEQLQNELTVEITTDFPGKSTNNYDNNSESTNVNNIVIVDSKGFKSGDKIKKSFYLEREGDFNEISYMIKYDTDMFTLDESSIQYFGLSEHIFVDEIFYTDEGAFMNIACADEGWVLRFFKKELFMTCEFTVNSVNSTNTDERIDMYALDFFDTDGNSIATEQDINLYCYSETEKVD